MSKYGFTVDEDVTELGADQALKKLRRMIRLGKMAERALQEIKAQGFAQGVVPLAEKAGWNNTLQISPVCMPKRELVSRADLPDLSLLHIAVGTPKEDEYSGNPCITVPVALKGIMMTQMERGRAVYKTDELERPIGMLRINKNHVSWLSSDYGEAHKMYWEYKYAIKSSAPALAGTIATTIVRLAPNVDKRCGKTVMLHDQAPEWLQEDGHIQRLMREMVEYARVCKVMSA